MTVVSSLRAWPVVLAACSFSPPAPELADAKLVDAPEIPPDAPESDLHVLITEISPRGAGANVEFLELYNPTPAAIDLSRYHLSDSRDYWKLPGHASNPQSQTIVLTEFDFLMKFPAGTMLPAGSVIVVAIDGVDFMMTFGTAPDFTTVIPVAGATAMEPIVEPATSSDVNQLTDEGEMVVLFIWDGTSDLVGDVDLVVHGLEPADPNNPIMKADIDGPDPDTTVSMYAADAFTYGGMVKDSISGESYKRIALEGALEVRTGGNGITGHDETSEQQMMTWDAGSLGVTPGIIPPALMR